jgi:tetratricopeptide (TPR) repeat protein
MDLADQNIKEKKYKAAADSLQVLVNLPDLGPEGAAVRLKLASALLALGERDKAMREALAAATQDVSELDRALRRAHAALPPSLSAELHSFITTEWRPDVQKRELTTRDQAKVLLFLARVNLFAADYQAAAEQVESAKRLDREFVLRECPVILFGPGTLPQVLEEETLAAHQIRGDLFVVCDCTDKAAREYLKAGTIAVRGNDPDSAVPLLRLSLELDPSLQPASWQLAEALRLASTGKNGQEETQRAKESVKLIEEAARIWDTAAEKELPDPDYFWTYTVRASICEQQARLGVGDFYERFWNGIALLEFGISVFHDDAFRWAMLSRLLRILHLHTSAVQASEEALRIYATDPTVIVERVISLVNSGDIDAADPIIDAQRSERAPPWEWWDSVKAFVELHRGHAKEALELLEPWLAVQPAALWALSLRAEAYELLEDYKSADASYETMLATTDPRASPAANEAHRASAAFALQRFETVEAIVAESKRRLDADNFNLDLFLGLTDLVRSRLGAEDRLAQMIRSASSQLDLNYVSVRLRIAQARYTWGNPEQARQAVEKLRAIIEECQSGLHRRTEEAELLSVIDKYVAGSDNGSFSADAAKSWPWWGAKLGLHRIYSGSGRDDLARKIHQDLTRAADRAPEICKRLATGLLGTAQKT